MLYKFAKLQYLEDMHMQLRDDQNVVQVIMQEYFLHIRGSKCKAKLS